MNAPNRTGSPCRGSLGAADAAPTGLATTPQAVPQVLTSPSPEPRHDRHRLSDIMLVALGDFGRGEPGSYGPQVIRTPAPDGLVTEGPRFTQAYANPSYTPTRALSPTGPHTGHARVESHGDIGKGLLADVVSEV